MTMGSPCGSPYCTVLLRCNPFNVDSLAGCEWRFAATSLSGCCGNVHNPGDFGRIESGNRGSVSTKTTPKRPAPSLLQTLYILCIFHGVVDLSNVFCASRSFNFLSSRLLHPPIIFLPHYGVVMLVHSLSPSLCSAACVGPESSTS